VGRNGSSTFDLAVLTDEGDDSVSAFERHVHYPTVLELRGWGVLHVDAATWLRRPQDVLSEIERRLSADAPSTTASPDARPHRPAALSAVASSVQPGPGPGSTTPT
jgi:hypothetical protein